MSISKSRGAYNDCRDLFERAVEDPKGCRVFIGPEGQAQHFIMRMHQARQLDRNDSAEVYEFGHPMYASSPWDRFKCYKREDKDGWWVYVEKVELNVGNVENLSEIVDYEFVEPRPQITHQQTLVIEHQPKELIRRRV